MLRSIMMTYRPPPMFVHELLPSHFIEGGQRQSPPLSGPTPPFVAHFPPLPFPQSVLSVPGLQMFGSSHVRSQA